MSARAPTLLAGLCAVLLAACGGDDAKDDPSALGGGNRAEAPAATPAAGGAPAPAQRETRVEVIKDASDGKFDPEEIFESDGPGVVTILAIFGGGSLESLLGGEGGGGGGGQGSGFVLNGRGEIATNAHVVTQGEGRAVKRASQLFVEFADGNQVEAKIVGDDPNADIALLKLDPKGLDLRPLPLADDEAPQVGSPVAALGSPFGEQQSLSVGVVSATDRTIDSLTDFKIPGAVQTDAAINPGNSGGPLLNADGEVIGVNQQIKSTSGGGEGVGFAVPVGIVRRSLEQLRKDGKADYAFLGVSSVGLYPQLVDRFELPVKKGAWLQEISAGGPAQDSDLKGGRGKQTFQARPYALGGDIVTAVEDERVDDPDDLSAAIATFEPGTKVSLELYRDGEKRTVEVELGERPVAPPPDG